MFYGVASSTRKLGSTFNKVQGIHDPECDSANVSADLDESSTHVTSIVWVGLPSSFVITSDVSRQDNKERHFHWLILHLNNLSLSLSLSLPPKYFSTEKFWLSLLLSSRAIVFSLDLLSCWCASARTSWNSSEPSSFFLSLLDFWVLVANLSWNWSLTLMNAATNVTLPLHVPILCYICHPLFLCYFCSWSWWFTGSLDLMMLTSFSYKSYFYLFHQRIRMHRPRLP